LAIAQNIGIKPANAAEAKDMQSVALHLGRAAQLKLLPEALKYIKKLSSEKFAIINPSIAFISRIYTKYIKRICYQFYKQASE
jgi:hypothetical protein